MPDLMKYLIDGIAGVALFMALMVVFVVDKVFFSGAGRASENTLRVNVIEDKSHGAKKLKLAVTPPGTSKKVTGKGVDLWDDMGKLLRDLGQGYRYDEVTPDEMLLNPKRLDGYDVLFLTCAPDGMNLKEILREFVANGGILYASDWRRDAVAAAFPDLVDQKLIGEGAAQGLEADVVDPALREVIGPKIHLTFDLGEWKTAAFSGPRVKPLIQGQYIKRKELGQQFSDIATAPLMVKMSFNKGTIIFTSFHNEKQNSEIEKKLLQYLVFSLVTAGIDADINSKLGESGFTSKGSNLLSAPKRNQSIVKNYENKAKSDLRFALGFRNEGAKLRFNIKSPEGQEYTWEGMSTVIIDVPGAAPGEWTYTVTDLHLPYENFAFTVTVGEKK